MPEGDTIFRIAVRLRPVLEHQQIVGATSSESGLDADSLVGHTVASIEPRGKHLLIHLDDDRTLHSHLGMTGAWHIYAVGAVWEKPVARAAISLATAQAVCVCFSPKTLELLSRDGLRRNARLHHLGPDVMADDFRAAEAFSRFRACGLLPIGEAIMNQTILCGVGNIYKSETLFSCKLNPFRSVASLSDDELRGVIATARRLMRANRTAVNRRTRFRNDGGRFWVYGRSGQPCYQCGNCIRVRRQGALGRSTYWCSECQPEFREA